MGSSSEEHIRMNYTIITEPLTEMEFFNSFTRNGSQHIKDWSRDFNDYDELFKGDPEHAKYSKAIKKQKIAREEYKDKKRKEYKK